MTTITWMDNRKLMDELWPKWRLEPVLSSILNEKWGSLHQDKLQSCIRQHRLVRDSKPDISAIHKAYCALIPQNLVGEREVEQTRNDLERCTPISAEDTAELIKCLGEGAASTEFPHGSRYGKISSTFC